MISMQEFDSREAAQNALWDDLDKTYDNVRNLGDKVISDNSIVYRTHNGKWSYHKMIWTKYQLDDLSNMSKTNLEY